MTGSALARRSTYMDMTMGFFIAFLLVFGSLWALALINVLRSPSDLQLSTPPAADIVPMPADVAPPTLDAASPPAGWAWESDEHTGDVPGWTTEGHGPRTSYELHGTEGATDTTGWIYDN